MDTSDRAAGRSGLVRLAPILILFSLPLIFVWAGLEWIAAGIPSLYSTKHEQLRRLAGEVDTLVVGSSAGLYGIAPPELPGSTYNLANYAQSLYYDDQIVTRSLPSLPKLKRVIVALHYISLFSTINDIAPERQYYYAQEWHIPPARWRDRFDMRLWSAVCLRTPERTVSELRTVLRRAWHGGPLRVPPSDPNLDDRGWWFASRSEPGPPDLSAAECKRSLAIHHHLMHLSSEQENLASLEHLITVLRARNIDVVLVVMPVWRGYFAGTEPEYLGRADRDLLQLARKHHARYFSFLNTPPLSADNYRDVQHLDSKGAVCFTRLVCSALERSGTD